jgi:hypothetical protein
MNENKKPGERIEQIVLILLGVLLGFFLIVQMAIPSTLEIIVEEGGPFLREVPIYRRTDVITIAITSLLLGFLIFSSVWKKEKTPVAEKRESPSDVINVPPGQFLKLFKGVERKIVEILMKEGEVNQSELAERAKIPKSSLSRILIELEWRGVIFRYNKGMSKMVKLAIKKGSSEKVGI